MTRAKILDTFSMVNNLMIKTLAENQDLEILWAELSSKHKKDIKEVVSLLNNMLNK